jgi:hypothetical protein
METKNRPRPYDSEHPDVVESGTPDLLRRAAELAIDYRRSLPERPVGPRPGTSAATLEAAVGGALPRSGTAATAVIEALAAAVDAGLVAMSGPR